MSKTKTIVTATTIADWFLSQVDRDSGDSITHLKLQKLVYYAQAWSLANFNKALFPEELEAWTHGPVAPSVWHRHKDSSWTSLAAPKMPPKLDREQDAILPLVIKSYGKYEAKFLEKLTHAELPWKKTRGKLPLYVKCSDSISKTLMRDYYAKKIKKTWEGPIVRS